MTIPVSIDRVAVTVPEPLLPEVEVDFTLGPAPPRDYAVTVSLRRLGFPAPEASAVVTVTVLGPGSGTVTGQAFLPVAGGAYVASVLAPDALPAEAVITAAFVAADPADDQYLRAVWGCQAKAARLGLVGIAGYTAQLDESWANLDFPALQLCVSGMPEENPGGTNAADDWKFPVRVSVSDRVDPSDPDQLARYLRWRGRLRDGFMRPEAGQNLPLPGVPDCLYTTAQPVFVVQADPAKFQFVTTVLVVKCAFRKTRP